MASYPEESYEEEVMESIAGIKYGLGSGEVDLAKDIFTCTQRGTGPEQQPIRAKRFLEQYTTGVNVEDIIS